MIQQADVALFQALNAAGPAALEPMMQVISWLGEVARVPLYAAALATLALAFYWRGRREPAEASAAAACRLLVGFVIAAPITTALKQALALPRPVALLEYARVFADPDSQYTFPSGHAMFAGLIAASLWPALGRWGRIGLTGYVAAIAVSRVWLGAHFPSDVAAGVLLGTGAGRCASWLINYWRSDKAIALAFGLGLLVVVLDAGTETVVVSHVAVGGVMPIADWFNVVHTRSASGPYALLHDTGGWPGPFFIGIATLAISIWLVRMMLKREIPFAYKLGCGSLLGGTLANTFDHVFRGASVDWLEFHSATQHWPAFNLADAAMAVGIAVVLSQIIVARKQRRRNVTGAR